MTTSPTGRLTRHEPQPQRVPSTMDLLIKFEEEGLSANEEVQLFSGLIKGGLAWSLQGSYGRAARDYIDQGILSPEGEILIEVEDPEEDVEPCCMLWKEPYGQDHEYGCPRAVEARRQDKVNKMVEGYTADFRRANPDATEETVQFYTARYREAVSGV